MAHWMFTDEHDMFRKSVRKFLTHDLEPYVERWEHYGEIPQAFFLKLAEMGYMGIHLPEDDGGSNAGYVTESVFLEELGKYGTGGIAAAVNFHLMSLSLIYLYGNEEHKRKYLQPGIRGEKIGTLAMEKSSSKSHQVIHATSEGDGYRLDGGKNFVINGVSADFICFTARTNPGAGADGITLFIMDTETDGIIVEKEIKKLGWRASDTADLTFDHVKAPQNAVMKRRNEHVTNSKQWHFVMLSFLGIGLAEKALEDTVGYSQERKQFGRSLNRFQVLQHKMADMAVDLEKARNLTYRALYLLAEGQDAEYESIMAKACTGEMVKRVTDTAVQIHGGMGYMMETPVQRCWRDARALSLIGGTTQGLNESIAALLPSFIEKKHASAEQVHSFVK